MFPECAHVPSNERPQQGDVLEWVVDQRTEWAHLGVVITADCDLAHRKHGGILSYVPVISVDDYMKRLHVPRLIEEELGRLRENVINLVRRLDEAKRDPGDKELSGEAILSMLRNDAHDVILAVGAVGADKKKLDNRVAAMVACEAALQTTDIETQRSAYLSARASLGTAAAQAGPALMNNMRGLLENPPGDILFLSMLSEAHSEGYVAYLRIIRDIDEARVAASFARSQDEGMLAYRISRLRSPYIYYLTQRLSSVFSAIGLPDEYEEQRSKLAAERYAAA